VNSAQLYYDFGWTMPDRGFESSLGYRMGYNGQEKSPEIADGHTTAMFWEYDSRIAKRWNVDPRPVVSISPYAVMQGNPILFSDPLGDTTRMYSSDGSLKYTFNDNYPNEEHFFDNISQKLQDEIIDAKGENAKADIVRANSKYFIGSKTRQQLKDIAQSAENEKYKTTKKVHMYPYGLDDFKEMTITRTGREKGFVAYYTQDNKELQIKDVSDELTGRTPVSVTWPNSIIQKYSRKTKGDFIFVAFGHTHGIYSIKEKGFPVNDFFNSPGSLNQPSRTDGLQDYDDLLDIYDKPRLSLLSTHHGYTVYSSAKNKENSRYKTIDNAGQIYNFKGTFLQNAK
jgi:hypothetical protein